MFDETAVLLASALPPRRVPALHLQIIHARLQEQARSRSLRFRTLLAVTGWALAAALIIIHFTHNQGSPGIPPETTLANQSPRPQDGSIPIAMTGATVARDPAPSNSTAGGNRRPSASVLGKLPPANPDRVAQLEQRLRPLEATERTTSNNAPGTSQLVLLELKDPEPGGTATSQGEIALRLLALLTRQFGQSSAGSNASALPGFNDVPPPTLPLPAATA